MPKFRVSGTITISVNLDVEADSLNAATKIAEEADLPTLCHQCGGPQDTGIWSTCGEFDGQVEIKKIAVIFVPPDTKTE